MITIISSNCVGSQLRRRLHIHDVAAADGDEGRQGVDRSAALRRGEGAEAEARRERPLPQEQALRGGRRRRPHALPHHTHSREFSIVM